MDLPITNSDDLQRVFSRMFKIAEEKSSELVTPEHLLLSLMEEEDFLDVLNTCNAKIEEIRSELDDYIKDLRCDNLDSSERTQSVQLRQLFQIAVEATISSGRDIIRVTHVMRAFFTITDSVAVYALLSNIDCDETVFMCELVDKYDPVASFLDEIDSEESDTDDDFAEDIADSFGVNTENEDEHSSPSANRGSKNTWQNLVVCVNDNLEGRNLLIGREKELEQTVRVLCRKDKNNVIHVGDPGVGKTALVYGLARMINEGKVPESLQDARIYQLDIATLLAGTQFRGDFEKRMKMIMEGISREKNPVVYIDEIHNLVGAGAIGEGAMDASNMLKPYLEAGKIRFIGSTTYDEYKRFFAKSKGLVRRFRQIDISEPTVDETIKILHKLKGDYESFHGVRYTDEALDFAVKGSARHINDRFLPDKAIDLIDETGAYRKIHPLKDGDKTVDKDLISEVLARICKVDSLAEKDDDEEKLATLEERISGQVFGQEAAVRTVTEAIQMSKAGLTEENKPLASLLFVGPTGVGKTEVAKVLASELGIELIRFDMSEYTEKHTVAKLIGSPAGYVGYEDGGLLTDAIRKNPNAVLLLDEIEKAHPDIYNILLQVMDYAKLTDNKGNKADFRNVVVIMTSNAGAQYAAMAKVGFGNNITSGEAMLKEVKKTFKPEFINRLTSLVVFKDMSKEMASMILDKKLRQLSNQLKAKNVTLELSDNARESILNDGFTKEYGARELDRVISSRLKPLLMRAILFGKLKQGGKAIVTVEHGQLVLQ